MQDKYGFRPPYLLIKSNGEVCTYYNFQELAKVCVENRLYVNNYHVVYYHDWNTNECRTCTPMHELNRVKLRGLENSKYIKKTNFTYIIRDDVGQIVSKKDIEKHYIWPNKKTKWCDWYEQKKAYAKIKGMPVPGTGTGKYRAGWHRSNKFVSIHRDFYAAISDEDIKNYKIKVKEKKETLPPTNWDDGCRASWYDRSWKKFRKTRWK